MPPLNSGGGLEDRSAEFIFLNIVANSFECRKLIVPSKVFWFSNLYLIFLSHNIVCLSFKCDIFYYRAKNHEQ